MIFRNPSIRLRLILWNAFVVLLILSVVFLGIYSFMQNRLESLMQSKVDSGYRTIEDVIRNSGGDICDLYHLGQGIMFQVTTEGKPVYQTEAWTDALWTSSLSEAQMNPYGSLRADETQFFRLKRGSVPEYNFEIIFAFEASDSLKNIKSLVLILVVGIPAALLLALIGGYFLAGRALSPVQAITRKAQDITAENLSERLPVRNPHDEIGHLAAVFNDTLGRLESSFEQLRRFTADASHELRTPLTSIRSVGEVALKKSGDIASCQEAIGSMLEETDRLTHLVDNLLILARGDAGKAKLTPTSINISAEMGEIVEELRILAEEKNQTLSTSIEKIMEVKVDKETLRLAVSNILHNAILYTQEGGRIEVHTAKAENGEVIIDIIDNGPGIPEAKRAKVFERFYRVDKARSRKEGGAGLGLAIARWAVEVNGGSIAFRDNKKPGTHCRIILPS
ncbi:MAG: HAMP domain-containing protein [Candidatus Aminicenantes bacterium]|nr:MAG: HAMP domain-containing protein [Candidatus Aminicenantes bacterium]